MIASPLRAALLASCLLLLAACTPTPATPTAADEPVPRAGECLAGSAETADGTVIPDHTTITPCTEPHRYAVVAAVSVPDNLLIGETPEEFLQNRADLLGANAALAAKYKNWAAKECASALASTVGLDSQSVAGVDATAAKLAPVGAFTPSYSLTDEPHWAAGIRSLVCTVQWLDATDAATSSPLSLPAGVHLAELFTSEFPVEARQCMVQGEPAPVLSDCSAPHILEPFLTFDAAAVFGADWVASVDPAAVSAQQYQQLDDACTELLEFAVGSANPAVIARAELTDAGWFDDSAAQHGVYCALASAESGRFDVEGSLIGIGNGQPRLVDAP